MSTKFRIPKRFMPLVGLAAITAVTGLGLRVGLPAGNQTAQDHRTAQTPADLSLAPGEAALRATINPETGRVDIVAGEPGALPLDPYTQQALRRDAQGLMERHHPDGSVSVDLQGRFQSASVANLDNSGKVTVCTDEALPAQTALNTSTSAPQEAPVQ